MYGALILCWQAVIGAGASGLICARECVREGHEVVIFEKSEVSGGTWVLDQIPQELQMMDSMTFFLYRTLTMPLSNSLSR